MEKKKMYFEKKTYEYSNLKSLNLFLFERDEELSGEGEKPSDINDPKLWEICEDKWDRSHARVQMNQASLEDGLDGALHICDEYGLGPNIKRFYEDFFRLGILPFESAEDYEEVTGEKLFSHSKLHPIECHKG